MDAQVISMWTSPTQQDTVFVSPHSTILTTNGFNHVCVTVVKGIVPGLTLPLSRTHTRTAVTGQGTQTLLCGYFNPILALS